MAAPNQPVRIGSLNLPRKLRTRVYMLTLLKYVEIDMCTWCKEPSKRGAVIEKWNPGLMTHASEPALLRTSKTLREEEGLPIFYSSNAFSDPRDAEGSWKPFLLRLTRQKRMMVSGILVRESTGFRSEYRCWGGFSGWPVWRPVVYARKWVDKNRLEVKKGAFWQYDSRHSTWLSELKYGEGQCIPCNVIDISDAGDWEPPVAGDVTSEDGDGTDSELCSEDDDKHVDRDMDQDVDYEELDEEESKRKYLYQRMREEEEEEAAEFMQMFGP